MPLAAGKPVALNNGGYLEGIVSGAGAGIVLPLHDPERAADMLHSLTTDKDALERAGKAARRLASEQFDRDALADRLEKTLLSAANLPGK